jgi:hypothetical protein
VCQLVIKVLNIIDAWCNHEVDRLNSFFIISCIQLSQYGFLVLVNMLSPNGLSYYFGGVFTVAI